VVDGTAVEDAVDVETAVEVVDDDAADDVDVG
jgi:hypothetical protein